MLKSLESTLYPLVIVKLNYKCLALAHYCLLNLSLILIGISALELGSDHCLEQRCFTQFSYFDKFTGEV